MELIGAVGHALRSPVVMAVEADMEGSPVGEVLDTARLWQLLGIVDHVLEFAQAVTKGKTNFDLENMVIPVQVALARTRQQCPHMVVHENLAAAWAYLDGHLIARVVEVLLMQAGEIQAAAPQPDQVPNYYVSLTIDSMRNEAIVSVGAREVSLDSMETVTLLPAILKGKPSAALFFCDQVVRMNNGEMWVSRCGNCDRDLCFHFSLPLVGNQ